MVPSASAFAPPSRLRVVASVFPSASSLAPSNLDRRAASCRCFIGPNRCVRGCLREESQALSLGIHLGNKIVKSSMASINVIVMVMHHCHPAWSAIRVMHHGQPSWLSIVVIHHGHPSCPSIMAIHHGHSSWSCIMRIHHGHPSWSSIMVMHHDRPS